MAITECKMEAYCWLKLLEMPLSSTQQTVCFGDALFSTLISQSTTQDCKITRAKQKNKKDDWIDYKVHLQFVIGRVKNRILENFPVMDNFADLSITLENYRGSFGNFLKMMKTRICRQLRTDVGQQKLCPHVSKLTLRNTRLWTVKTKLNLK